MSSYDEAGPPVAVAEDSGLWRVRWFRVLTIINVAIVAVSACVWIAQLPGPPFAGLWWGVIAFPVVPATAAMPVVSVVIIAIAAGLSALNMIGERRKGARFLRAMTIYGTIVLGVPVVFTAVCALISGAGALVSAIGGPR